jgi:hypothetical protein
MCRTEKDGVKPSPSSTPTWRSFAMPTTYSILVMGASYGRRRTSGLSLPWLAPYHRTNPNHRSIVSAIAVQATLVTTRNTKPKPNIASARYSVPTVAPTPTNKAHAARPMRLMFNWKRRLARLQGGFGRDSIGGNTIYIFTSLHLSRGDLQCDHANYKRARRLVWANTTHSRCRPAPVVAENEG